MELDELERHWDTFGERDPLWAILSKQGKRGGGWDLEEFFATGRADVEKVMSVLDGRGVKPARGRALDFGCGVGRLTQALSGYFELCDGVDLATSMIARAERFNPRPDRIRFHHNEAPNLTSFEDASFDFILSLLVLQHMQPALMSGYLREFVRILRPGAIAYFNIPERQVHPDPLPPGAWQAAIEPASRPRRFAAGEVQRLDLRVTNTGSLPWPAAAAIQLGNHWLDGDDRVVVPDDGRTAIEVEVPRGQALALGLDVTCPEMPGDYVLELDLVQEWISWFADRGSSTLRLPVRVEAGEGPGAGAAEDSFKPAMEMHHMAPSAVEDTLREAGGVVLASMPSARNAPGFPSRDYMVARGATRGTRRRLPMPKLAIRRRQ